MKNILYIFFVILSFNSCKKECIETPGKSVEREFEVPAFTKIIVFQGVEVHIIDSPIQKIVVKTGINRLNNIFFQVIDATLEIKSDDSCGINPTKDPIKVFIFSPIISSIRNSGEYTIYSDGILTYPSIELISEDFQSNYLNIGNFQLEIQNQDVSVISNGYSNIQIKGFTNYLYLGYFSGLGKFEGKEFLVNQIEFYHRGENNLKVNPIQSLKGQFYSVGNLISYNHPPIVLTSEHYTGKLVFE